MATFDPRIQKVRVTLDAKFEYFILEPKTGSSYTMNHAIRELWGHSPTNSLNYPVVPNFLNLSRLQLVSQGDIELNEPKTETSVVETPQEDVQKAIEKAIKETQTDAAYKIKRTLLPDSFDDQELDSDEGELQAGLLLIENELRAQIMVIAEKLAKDAKLTIRKKVRKTVQVSRTEKATIFFGEADDVLMHFEFIGRDAEFVNLLLPTILRLQEKLATAKRWRTQGVPVEERDYEVKGKYVPFEHQWVMYKRHLLFDQSSDLSQMGVAKTFPVLMTIDKRIQMGLLKKGRTLVLCPATVMPNWEKEINLHTPHLTCRILTGSSGERFNDLIDGPDQPDIYIMNYEFAIMKAKFRLDENSPAVEIPLPKLMTLIDWDMIVLDEVHRIKNPGAKRTPLIVDAFKDVKYRIIMSGTISANKLHDMHIPFIFLNRARAFNPIQYNYRVDEKGKQQPLAMSTLHDHFLTAFFQKSGYNYVPRHFALKTIRRFMEECSVRFEKSECMSLPPKMYEMRIIDMHEDQAKLYFALRDRMTADLGDMIGQGGRMSVFNVLALMRKLAEAANGWIYEKSGKALDFPWNPKLDVLEEMIDDLDYDAKVVVWSQFTNDLHKVAAKLKKTWGDNAVRIIHGGVSCSVCGATKDGRFESTAEFNDMKSEVRFLVANPGAGGEGIDMTGASYEFYFSNSFNKLHRMQSEDRCHRPGMQSKLTIIDLVMKQTIDEKVYGALRSWKSMAASLLEHLGLDEDAAAKLLGPGDFTLSNEPPVITDHTALKNERSNGEVQQDGTCSICRENVGIANLTQKNGRFLCWKPTCHMQAAQKDASQPDVNMYDVN